MVIEWFRSGFEKESGKKQVKGRGKIGYSQVNNSVILRISYVYVTYILRIWYVINKGKTGFFDKLVKRDGSSYAQSARNLNKSLTLPTSLKGRLTQYSVINYHRSSLCSCAES